eukprot:CAMPEP_0197727024 /NCGR_PEP_ID=MMETSP1434-20131217/18148_1 /TAXON_ID=265543 /ORGANISM="Minutocellus polymorphus, Strain CCMP3303" /LENGTH=371 /DNA_ID=CAMNT_0043313109 /DNA_START=59 /DNA_END=1174 /DNA_ORIENTATION=+
MAVPISSLELAMGRAFNALYEDGTYAKIWGGGGGAAAGGGVLVGIRAPDTCVGPADAWPTVPVDEVEPKSDLARVLSRGTFVCGTTTASAPCPVHETVLGQPILKCQRGAPGSSELENPKNTSCYGALVDWYDALTSKVGEMYGVPSLQTVWDTSVEDILTTDGATAAQLILEGVYNGTYDGGCGIWSQSTPWTNPATGQVEPRSIGLSSHVCKTYLRDTFLFTYGYDSGIKSWYDLKLAVESGGINQICTIDEGSCADCSSVVQQYIYGGGDSQQSLCQGGYDREEAFASLVNGTCQVIYGSAPPVFMLSEPINWFPSPVSQVYGSYFRRPPEVDDSATTASSAVQLMAKNMHFTVPGVSAFMFAFIIFF